MEVVDTLHSQAHTFHPPVRLSEAPLWDWQQYAYQQTPTNIWPTVPSWMSSNRLQAQNYAELCCQYIRDLVTQQQLNPGEPIYIIELGAGHGKLSTMMIDCLAEEKAKQSLEAYPTCHVLMDVNPHAIAHWRAVPQLAEAQASNGVDFIICDIDQLKHAHLYTQKTPLTDTLKQHHTLVIAHYLLDTLPCDYYYRDHDHQNHMLLCSTGTDKHNLLHHRQPKDMSKVQLAYQTTPLEDAPYPEALLNTSLMAHLDTQPKDSHTSFPFMALRMLAFFKDHAHKSLLICLQDKATWQQRSLNHLSFEMHGNIFSYDVHFGVLKRFLQPWSYIHRATVPYNFNALTAIHTPSDALFTHTNQSLISQYTEKERNKLNGYMIELKRPTTSLSERTDDIATLADDPTYILIVLRKHLNQLAKTPELARSLLEKMMRYIDVMPDRGRYDALAAQAYYRLKQPEQTLACFHQLNTDQQHTVAQLKAAAWAHKQMGDASQAQYYFHQYIKHAIKSFWHGISYHCKRTAYHIKRYIILAAGITAMVYFALQYRF